MRLWYCLFFVYQLLIIVIQECNCARILVYIPMPFYSHQATYRPLFKELANRGHQITLVTLNPMEPHENITQIDLSIIYKQLDEKNFFKVLSTGDHTVSNVVYLFDLVLGMAEVELSLPKVRELVNGSERFDLVITEFYMSFGSAFAYKYKCPLIGVVSMDLSSDKHAIIGNPSHPILYPSTDVSSIGQLNFYQRFLNTAFYLTWQAFIKYWNFQQDRIIRKYFGDHMPSVYELEKNVSMFFTNTNPVFHTARPLGPQTINVGGGLNIEKPKPLPSDIQSFLDQSKEGAIYFSLGSSVKSSQVSNKTKSVIIETFSKLPYNVLWKFESENASSFPENVLTAKWLPQQDVLRHPNVKLFITQGGLQSLEEALFLGVPVLALPFFGDQLSNAKRVTEYGIGLSLDHKTLEVPEFKSAILELITSSRYKDSTIELAKQLSDRPMTGIQQAVWWIEYVLRHPNVDILKHPNPILPLYQYYFLDVIFCLLCFCVVFFYFVKFLIKLIGLISSRLLSVQQKLKWQ